MPYQREDVLRHFRTITRHIPRTAAVGIDVIGNLSDRAMPVLVLENQRGTHTRVDLTRHLQVETRAIERLKGSLGLTFEAAAEVYTAGAALQDINPRGAWCVQPQAENDPLIRFETNDFAGRQAHEVPYLAGALEGLKACLPGVTSIEADVRSHGLADGRVRRRTWLRFVAGPQEESAAIDTAVIATHVRDGLLHCEHEHLQANLVRMETWARQLEIDPDKVPEALHLTALFTTTVGGGKVILQ